jgi:heme exporter protein D
MCYNTFVSIFTVGTLLFFVWLGYLAELLGVTNVMICDPWSLIQIKQCLESSKYHHIIPCRFRQGRNIVTRNTVVCFINVPTYTPIALSSSRFHSASSNSIITALDLDIISDRCSFYQPTNILAPMTKMTILNRWGTMHTIIWLMQQHRLHQSGSGPALTITRGSPCHCLLFTIDHLFFVFVEVCLRFWRG